MSARSGRDILDVQICVSHIVGGSGGHSDCLFAPQASGATRPPTGTGVIDED